MSCLQCHRASQGSLRTSLELPEEALGGSGAMQDASSSWQSQEGRSGLTGTKRQDISATKETACLATTLGRDKNCARACDKNDEYPKCAAAVLLQALGAIYFAPHGCGENALPT